MKYFKITVFMVFILIFISCNKNQNEAKTNLESKPKKVELKAIENFDEFNIKFHSDSVFQVARVDFPIDGKHIAGFENYNWTRKNWQFLRVPVSEKNEIDEYEHTLVKTDTLITEKFWIPDSGFEVERQFKLIDNKWFLTYYDDINL